MNPSTFAPLANLYRVCSLNLATLMSQVLTDVVLCHWLNGSSYTMMDELWSFETPKITHQTKQCHILGDFIHQQFICENLQPRTTNLSFKNRDLCSTVLFPIITTTHTNTLIQSPSPTHTQITTEVLVYPNHHCHSCMLYKWLTCQTTDNLTNQMATMSHFYS
jgi:hypothetical protein